jgi:phosphoribosylformylglycinamidine cyclo-ligase
MNKHDTIGQDAVAMCVNDIAVQGAEPLFFLDYLAVGALDPVKAAAIVGGVAAGCRLAGCALLGGETAEMPGIYQPGEYDLAGFAVGVVEKSKIVDGTRVREGDVMLALPSSGLHSNGYSLARHIFFAQAGWQIDRYVPEFGRTLGEELLEPTRIYTRPLLAVLEGVRVGGMAHITGGGLVENIPRCLPEGLGAVLDRTAWEAPPVFSLLQSLGDVPDNEMVRTFNMGLGLMLIVPEKEAALAMRLLREAGERPVAVGEVVRGMGVCFR